MALALCVAAVTLSCGRPSLRPTTKVIVLLGAGVTVCCGAVVYGHTHKPQVEQFAMGEYAQALAAGAELAPSERNAVAEKLHQYTGLPVDYILKADLRIDGGEFRQNLRSDGDLTTGRLDSRFSGPDLDPLSQRADYDPQATALSSAYVTAFNEYARKELHYGDTKAFKASVQFDFPRPARPPHAHA